MVYKISTLTWKIYCIEKSWTYYLFKLPFKAKKRYTDLRSKNEESGVRLEPSHDMDKENEPLEEGIIYTVIFI